MKKLLYLMIAAVLPLAFTSCNDDNDLPKVNISINVSGATNVDNTLYVVKGDALKIESINIEDLNGKGAVIGQVTYYLDYVNIGTVYVAPYSMTIDTTGLPVGTHLLQARLPIYAVDSPVSVGWIERNVVIVNSASEIPGGNIAPENPTE